MLTVDELRRMAAKVDGSAVLDTDLKESVLQANLDDCVAKIQTKLKRTRKGGKVVVFWGETK